MISIIVAMGKNRVIGKKNALPWHLPADLKHFKEITKGHAVIMGKNTHQSIGRALPGRLNIVLSGDKNYKADDCIVVSSIQEALKVAQGQEEIFFIGGGNVYKQALPLADRLYITLVDAEFEGDVFCPEIDYSNWKEVSREDCNADEKNPYNFSFLIFERKDNG